MAEETPGAIIGRTVRRLRDAGLWTRDELAERSGVSRQAIAHLELGASDRPRRVTVEKLAKGLGVDVETLLAGVDGEAPKGEEPPSPTEEQERRNDSFRASTLLSWAEEFRTLARRRRAALEQAQAKDLPGLVYESIYVVNGANDTKRRTLDPEAEGGSPAVLDAAAEVEQALRELEDALFAISDEAQKHNAAVAAGVEDQVAEMRRRKAS